MEKRIVYLIPLIVSLIGVTFLVLNSYEATVLVRCDGEDIFPIGENDSVIEGKAKLSNAILTNIGANLWIYESYDYQTKNRLASKALYDANEKCKFQKISNWYWR